MLIYKGRAAHDAVSEMTRRLYKYVCVIELVNLVHWVTALVFLHHYLIPGPKHCISGHRINHNNQLQNALLQPQSL